MCYRFSVNKRCVIEHQTRDRDGATLGNLGKLCTPFQFAEAATNKIYHWRLVRRWNKCVKPLPVVV